MKTNLKGHGGVPIFTNLSATDYANKPARFGGYSGPTTWSKEDTRQLEIMVSEGKTSRQIADALGRSEASANRRIDNLSETRKTAKRPCLCCGKAFNSEGPHNRLCATCRTRTTSPYQY